MGAGDAGVAAAPLPHVKQLPPKPHQPLSTKPRHPSGSSRTTANVTKPTQVENYGAPSSAITPLQNLARGDFEARCPLKCLFSRDNSLPSKHCCPSPQCTFAEQNSFVFINFLSSYLDLFQYSECIRERERERENSGRFSGNSKFFFTEIEIIWQGTVKYFEVPEESKGGKASKEREDANELQRREK